MLAAVTLFVGTPAASAEDCFRAPREIGAPREGLIYTNVHQGSTKNAPSTVDFRSTEQFMLILNRLPAGGPGKRSDRSAPLGLKIRLRDPATGKSEVYCEVGRIELDAPFRDAKFFIYSPRSEQLEWRIELSDHGVPAGPAYGTQDPIHVQVVRFPVANAAEDAYGKRDGVASSMSIACDSFWARLEKYAPRGPVRQERTIGPSLRSHVFYVRSPGPVQVEFRTDIAAIPLLLPSALPQVLTMPKVTIASKNDGAGAFIAGCTQSPGLGGFELGVVQAALERSYQPLQPPVWRVEVDAAKDMSFDTRVLLRYPMGENPEEPFPSELQCAPDNASRAMTRETNTRPFAGATLLQVALADPEALITPAAREEITRHILLGMALWRPVCYLCTPDQLALAKVDGKWYALQGLVEALGEHYQRVAAGEPPSAIPALSREKFSDVMFVLGSRFGGRGFFGNAGYVELPQELPAGLAGLCKDTYDELPLSLKRIRNGLQCAGDPKRPELPSLAASAVLAFRTTELDGCPSGENTVACESSALRIDLNAKDYTFSSHYGGARVAGTGSRNVNLLLVLTHEIGHWIGIGHLEQRGSMMSESMGGSRCIDAAATNALNVIAAGGAFQVKKPQALLWDAPGR